MAKRKVWLTYEQASRIATEAGCKSRKQFMDWHVENRISDIPKQPNRVYSSWQGWPEFLSTSNVFAADKDKGDKFRPYWEGVRWAQQYCAEKKITTGQGWKHAWQADRDKAINAIPIDIPKHPENIYKNEWTGWVAWLGKSVQAKIESAQEMTPLLCIANSTWSPSNVITIVMSKSGEDELLDLLHNKSLLPVRMFKFEEVVSAEIRQVLESCGKLQPSGAWIVSNVNYLISEIGYLLELFKPSDMEGFRKLTAAHNAQRDPNPDTGFDLEEDKHTTKLSNTGMDFV